MLVSDQRKQTKDPFGPWMESTLSSKAILFLAFQIVQEMQKGLAFQSFLCFLPTKVPFQPKSVALTEKGSTHDTPKRVNNISHKALVFTQWRRM